MKQRGERHEFASDNTAGICPEAFEALENANVNGAPSYGDDRWTARVCDRIRELFETDCDVYFVFNGTAANALALAQLCQSFQSVVCHEYSHIQTDECGAPEFFTKGSQLLLISGGNRTPERAAFAQAARSQYHSIDRTRHGLHAR
jgi:threonine aldolase